MKTTGQRSSTLTAFCAAALLCALSALVIPTSPAFAATTERISVSTSGEQANGASGSVCISSDGRFVAFESEASNLVPGDTNAQSDIFVRDRLSGAIERVSVSSTGEQGNGMSWWPAISADGRFVAFDSEANNLVPGDTNEFADAFVHDRLTGTTERVSVSSAGEQAYINFGGTSISADGRCVAFLTDARNLVPGDTNGRVDVFVRDRETGTTERVSVSSTGQQANSESISVSLSADGRFAAFSSAASNLVPNDTNSNSDVLVRDRQSGTTERVSVSSVGAQANYGSYYPAISADGRFVIFDSDASNLVSGDTNGIIDVFLRDRLTGKTERVSLDSSGAQGNNESSGSSVTTDGRFVAFTSYATNLAAGDTGFDQDVFLRDRATGVTEMVSVSTLGFQGNGNSWRPAISADGRFVIFDSDASNLVPGDTNGVSDVFVRDREATVSASGIAINADEACTNSRDVTLSLLCPSGSTQMRLRSDPGDWAAWEACASEKAWTLSSGDGLKKVCLQCRDVWGTLSPEVSDDIVLDTTPPSGVSIVINNGAACANRSDFSFTLSAVGASEYRLGWESEAMWTDWETYTPNAFVGWGIGPSRGGSFTFQFQCRDSCGNESEIASDDIWVALFTDVGCAQPQRPYIEALALRYIVSYNRERQAPYYPYKAITRAQFAQALCKAAGKTPLDKATPTFADVPKTHPAYGWIERLADPASWGGTPVTDGCGIQGAQKLFCPDASVTREQSAKLICRAAGKAAMSSCSGVFADVPSARPLCPYVERLADAASWPGGIAVTNGCGQSGATRWFCPASALTRGQMAVFLVRAFGIPL